MATAVAAMSPGAWPALRSLPASAAARTAAATPAGTTCEMALLEAARVEAAQATAARAKAAATTAARVKAGTAAVAGVAAEVGAGTAEMAEGARVAAGKEAPAAQVLEDLRARAQGWASQISRRTPGPRRCLQVQQLMPRQLVVMKLGRRTARHSMRKNVKTGWLSATRQ